MKKFIEQLESNDLAIFTLQTKYNVIEKSKFYSVFSTYERQQTQLQWNLKVQKRVLRMRYRLLENIKGETIKQMQDASVMSRELNLIED